jgi:hypothetical protein
LQMKKYLMFILITVLIACGKKNDDDIEAQRQEEDLGGTYAAFLLPVNVNLTKSVSGNVEISRYGDDFLVKLNLNNAPPGIHKQYLHTGHLCPGPLDDEDRDGYVDTSEAIKLMGNQIVPFDDDLSSQTLGLSHFPSGNYNYVRSTSYSLMLADLHLIDEIINDHLVKLSELDLPLEKRVVAVYSESPVGDIPIACGVLTKIAASPSDDSWGQTIPSPRIPEPSPPRRPRSPDLEPEDNGPQTGPDDTENDMGWWQRMRDRWRRWRDRITDRWSRQ